MTVEAPIEERVRAALELIRPALQADGGDIRLESVDGKRVVVSLFGTCGECPISPVTLRHGVERILRERVPGITEVVAVEA